ncbi:MAG: malate synthase A [Propionibacteriaceae bacterium]|nr:malate synthase A [Propionibacteriaceae bacterium]
MTTETQGIQVIGPVAGRQAELLTPAALAFLAGLHSRFNPTRLALLEARQARSARLAAGERPAFLAETADLRSRDWRVAPLPADLQDRRVEITGPVDRKMIINALNSGAKVFMADFEDAHTPSWANCLDGQLNLQEALDRTITYTAPDGRDYRLNETVATLFVRPRGWHLVEKHVLVDGEPISGSLFDFGLYLFHNAGRLQALGTGPYFYLPKLESHLEARLWNEVFVAAQERLGLPQGTIKATVLIETILAAFELDEILYELRDHSAGLNAGRWDYLFSCIKQFRSWPELVFPDRGQLTMTVPFMRAYTERLVQVCHRRGAPAIGGMAAFIPSRRDPAVNAVALTQVRADKERESRDGFDGTWVAHPDLVPVAKAAFDEVLGERPNQLERQRPEVNVTAEQLLDFRVPGGTVTEAGLRNNLSVGLQYLASWLRGVGAAAINNLMEDAATAEISRSQVWQWVQRGVMTAEGRPVTREWVRQLLEEELAAIEAAWGPAFATGRFGEARALFERVALGEDYVEFLTLPAYEYLD